MNLPDLKALKKLTDFCRKTGIKTYECADFKITLVDSFQPVPSLYLRRKTGIAKPSARQSIQCAVPIDTPSAEELLFLSCGGPPDGFDAGDIA